MFSSIGRRSAHGRVGAAIGGAAAVAWLATTAAAGTQKSVQVEVSAKVLPRARLDCRNSPERLNVELADVRSGYKEVALACTVVTNDSRGAIVRFVPREGLATLIRINGLSRPLVLEREAVEVWQEAGAHFELQIWFNLHKDLAPGVYPVPLLVLATPVSDSAAPQP